MEQATKASLRTEARRILSSLSIEKRVCASMEICERIAEMPEWAAAGTVGVYNAQKSEPDLACLLGGSDKIICFPRVSGSALDFHHCESGDHLRRGSWNILEPDPAYCPIVPASKIDLLLIPGLAFTRAGGRLGRGGGFYDRYLSQVHPRAVKIGVCFEAQIVSALPVEIHDHEVDLVVTEAETIRCGR